MGVLTADDIARVRAALDRIEAACNAAREGKYQDLPTIEQIVEDRHLVERILGPRYKAPQSLHDAHDGREHHRDGSTTPAVDSDGKPIPPRNMDVTVIGLDETEDWIEDCRRKCDDYEAISAATAGAGVDADPNRI